MISKNRQGRAGKTAQQVKVLAAKADDVSSRPGSHMVEELN